jgi:hypothetical protein
MALPFPGAHRNRVPKGANQAMKPRANPLSPLNFCWPFSWRLGALAWKSTPVYRNTGSPAYHLPGLALLLLFVRFGQFVVNHPFLVFFVALWLCVQLIPAT